MFYPLKKKVISSFLLLFFFLVLAIEEGPFLNQKAPDFSLKPCGGGQPVTLSQLKGKPVFILFWATWCGPCRKEIPKIKELYKRFSDKGIVFLSIAIDYRQKEEDVVNFKKVYEIPYMALWDKDNEVSAKYYVRGVPTILLIDKDGIIKFRDNYVNVYLEQLLANLVQEEKKGEK